MKITKIFSLIILLSLSFNNIEAKKKEVKEEGYKFTTVKALPITPVRNQFHSGTCWAFSTIAFLESEAIRINKLTDPKSYPDFSVMYVVSKSYQDRAEKYVRMDGNLTFAAGSEAGDVIHIVKNYGIVPLNEMKGLNYGTDKPVHNELDALALAYVKVMAKNPNKKLSTAWKKGFKGIMDSYLGECPTNFVVDGKEYTPASYRDALGINPDNYIGLTSYSHQEFYKPFVLEVCDNWRGDAFYNLPIDEFMSIFKHAIENGYTIAWGTDVSEEGFTRDGLGIFPTPKELVSSGSDQERWTGPTKKDKKTKVEKKEMEEEIYYTQEQRQEAYDNKKTTDDHGMQIFGIAKDQYGKEYFMVKNSWGTSSSYKGIWYVTPAFIRNKTMSILVHKDALPQAIKDKLSIK